MDNQQVKELRAAWSLARDFLLKQAASSGHWTGELSASALSTATAVSALSQVRLSGNLPEPLVVPVRMAITQGYCWLSEQQNGDGGFGDTNRSHSNIATTLLVLAAWELADQTFAHSQESDQSPLSDLREQKAAGWRYVQRQGSWDGLRRRYGKDKTFVVPILSNCALAGLVAWREVPALPFEAAWLPQDLYRWARLPVVSYAVPALVAIGQARFHFSPPKNPLVRAIRAQAQAPTLRVLRNMQPASGGYLEATPLTSFVLMSLAAAGNGHLPVARDCLRFLLDSKLEDGSWPIDTNLATWLTSLTICSVARRGKIVMDLSPAAVGVVDREEPLVTPKTIRWLLNCQHTKRHPFTGANPGGWGWTDLSGAVPDADDTPAALLALAAIDWHAKLERLRIQAFQAVGLGLGWLVRLQNKDGGWPTFCRGWGTLAFDRSGTDLTAHALRALTAWLPHWDELQRVSGKPLPRRSQIDAALRHGLDYLARTQQTDGSWKPLWFGNQDRDDEDNPVYGTGKVLVAYAELGLSKSPPAIRGAEYLRRHQNADGGWGGGPSVQYVGINKPTNSAATSTIEETSVALEGLLALMPNVLRAGIPASLVADACTNPGSFPRSGQSDWNTTIMQAITWLVDAAQVSKLRCSWPIGFYFAKLWYHEQLYPAIFSLSALGVALELVEGNDQSIETNLQKGS